MTAPNRFHIELYHLVYDAKPMVTVETGYNLGKSAMQILAALDNLEQGIVYSIELVHPQTIFHPRLHFKEGLSTAWMPEVFMETGAWDFFLHDSDHEVGCTTFEYELAYRLLKPGGIIMSDDLGWGVPPHYSWQKCMARHGITDFIVDGGAGHYFKPITEPPPQHNREWLDQQISEVKELTNQACRDMNLELYFK